MFPNILPVRVFTDEQRLVAMARFNAMLLSMIIGVSMFICSMWYLYEYPFKHEYHQIFMVIVFVTIPIIVEWIATRVRVQTRIFERRLFGYLSRSVYTYPDTDDRWVRLCESMIDTYYKLIPWFVTFAVCLMIISLFNVALRY